MDEYSINEKTNISRNFFWSIKEIWLYNPRYILLLIFDSIFKGFIPVMSMLLMQNLMNILQINNALLSSLLKLFILITLVEILQELSTSYFQFRLTKFETEYKAALQVKLLRKASSLEAKTFEKSDTYDLISRMQYDADTGILGYINIGFEMISCTLALLAYAAILIYYNFIIIFVILVIPVVKFFINRKFNIVAYDLIKNNTKNERKAH